MTSVTTTSSTSTDEKSAPIAWVDSLFARMTACYGSKFADMWRDADVDLVKSLWAAEMGKLSNDELKHGYQSLMSKPWPPTLPEYVLLCKSAEKKATAHVFALPTPARSELSKEKAGEMLGKLGMDMKPKTDHKLWAKRILEAAKHPLHSMSALQIRFAKEAMAAK